MNDNHYQVLNALEQLGTATVADLAQHLPFHETTIRKYLGELEQAQKVEMRKVRKKLKIRSGAITIKEGASRRFQPRQVYGYTWRVK